MLYLVPPVLRRPTPQSKRMSGEIKELLACSRKIMRSALKQDMLRNPLSSLKLKSGEIDKICKAVLTATVAG